MSLFARRLRRNAVYRPVALDRLTADERRTLGDIDGDDVAVALLPTEPALSAKAICAETAKLLASLETPAHVDVAMMDGDPSFLARLVLDSVLEVEDGDAFVTGANAVHVVGTAAGAAAAPQETVSMEALRYGEQLALGDAPALSSRLYGYNHEPLTPRWTRRIADEAQLARWLGLARSTRRWIATPPHADNPGWLHFRAPHARSSRLKLYVCPRAELLPEALAEAAAVFAEHGIGSFKVGRDLHGVLRPDKLVAYAPSRERIDAAADALRRRLHGMPAQALPFAAALSDDGLVAWGIDPPRNERVSKWQGTSWRRWITDRLAVAMIAARAAHAASPSQFALQRVALEGIDVQSWTPVNLAWETQ